MISSFILPRLICRIFWPISVNEFVILLVMNNAIAPAIRKMNAFRFMMVTRKFEISCFSSCCE